MGCVLSSGILAGSDSNQPAQLQSLARIEKGSFACSKFLYNTIHCVNNKGTDQTEKMRMLV